MLVMLGDEVTLVKGETTITGKVAGVVLDDARELERLYIHGIGTAFWMSDKWQVVEEMEYEEDGEI